MLGERKRICDRLWECAADRRFDDSKGVKERENETNYRVAKEPPFPVPVKGRECRKNSEGNTEIGN